MPLPDGYKSLKWGKYERPLVLYPWQLGKLNEFACALEEVSNLGGAEENPLQSTLSIVARDFFDLLEHIDEEVEGGAK